MWWNVKWRVEARDIVGEKDERGDAEDEKHEEALCDRRAPHDEPPREVRCHLLEETRTGDDDEARAGAQGRRRLLKGCHLHLHRIQAKSSDKHRSMTLADKAQCIIIRPTTGALADKVKNYGAVGGISRVGGI